MWWGRRNNVETKRKKKKKHACVRDERVEGRRRERIA
jgi:hypothetical protein